MTLMYLTLMYLTSMDRMNGMLFEVRRGDACVAPTWVVGWSFDPPEADLRLLRMSGFVVSRG